MAPLSHQVTHEPVQVERHGIRERRGFGEGLDASHDGCGIHGGPLEGLKSLPGFGLLRLVEELRAPQDRLQHVVHVVGDPGRQRAHGLQALGLHELLLGRSNRGQRFAQVPIELVVLQRDGGLIGEGADDLEILGAEGTSGDVTDAEGPDHPILNEQRDGEHRVIAHEALRLHDAAHVAASAVAREA